MSSVVCLVDVTPSVGVFVALGLPNPLQMFNPKGSHLYSPRCVQNVVLC